MDTNCWICLANTAPLYKLNCGCKTAVVHIECATRWFLPRMRGVAEGRVSQSTWTFSYSLSCNVCNMAIPSPFPEMLVIATQEACRKSGNEESLVENAALYLKEHTITDVSEQYCFRRFVRWMTLCTGLEDAHETRSVKTCAVLLAAAMIQRGCTGWHYILSSVFRTSG
jgi:hypothetical protein